MTTMPDPAQPAPDAVPGSDGETPSPRPSSPCNCFAIRSAARQISQFYDRHLAGTGLRTTQFSVLAQLSRAGPLAINELAVRMAMDRTTTGRALRPLEREGLVVIGPGRDGRTRALSLTEAGRARLAEAVPFWREAQAAFEARLGREEAAALRAALKRVRDLESAPTT
ncbi:MarR family winged helix-turn-helix transcriptional regulator [Enterovirga rhinocerotis]|uniref:MarR family transcriptional regulator n=1 Tax=Enterovirga rhinocerotis TaxID=1339210 RepID=A0A4R7BY78_9HYPH|nr:MarR family winged helix-turn-helix transcriptional regulator [Enterovirga rhinocerotis]TDR90503.1 MarR family transcriptional regulator [Enterovirga rhinocerotis]